MESKQEYSDNHSDNSEASTISSGSEDRESVHSCKRVDVQRKGSFGSECTDTSLNIGDSFENHTEISGKSRPRAFSEIESSKKHKLRDALINDTEVKTRKLDASTQVIKVDISRPLKMRSGDGIPCDDSVIANISYPISLPLPGLSAYDTECLYKGTTHRWDFMMCESKISGCNFDNRYHDYIESNESENLDTSALLNFPEVKNYPEWFDFCEMCRLEELFLSSSLSGCRRYLFIRNAIIQAYLNQPHLYLSVSDIASNLKNVSLVHITLIHRFLEMWDIINSKARSSPPRSLTLEFIGLLRERVRASLGAEVPGSKKDIDRRVALTYSHNIPDPEMHAECFNEKREMDTQENEVDPLYPKDTVPQDTMCLVCNRNSVLIAYRNISLPFLICSGCFKRGRFPLNTPSFDYLPVCTCGVQDLLEEHKKTGEDEDQELDQWSDKQVLRLLVAIEKSQGMNWAEILRNTDLESRESQRISLRTSSMGSEMSASRKRRLLTSKRNPPLNDKPAYIVKRKKKIGVDSAQCVQYFASLPYSDFALNDSSAKRSILEITDNPSMLILCVIMRTVGAGIASAGAKRGLEFTSRYVETHLAHRGISALKEEVSENMVAELKSEILKGAVQEAHTAANWENNAAEILVQQLIDLQYRKICCKMKLIELLDQG